MRLAILLSVIWLAGCATSANEKSMEHFVYMAEEKPNGGAVTYQDEYAHTKVPPKEFAERLMAKKCPQGFEKLSSKKEQRARHGGYVAVTVLWNTIEFKCKSEVAKTSSL